MFFVLDTDHMSVLEWGDSGAGRRLIARLNTVPTGEAATTIVTFEEQTRGWLSVLARSRSLDEQIDAYTRLKRFKSLKNLQVDRLQFEHQKRQQKVQTLCIEVNRLSRELEEDYEEVRLHRQRDPSFFRDAGPTMFTNEGAIDRNQAQIRGLEEEMEAIEKVLDAKWK